MRLKLYLSTLLIGWSVMANAQSDYDVAKIPAELLKNSTAIVRNEEKFFVIKSRSSAVETYKLAITIMSKNSEVQANMLEYYDKFSSIYNLKAAMYDGKGQKIKTYKSSDFKDRSLTSAGTMFDDNRIKELDFFNASYPYTVEYSYEISYNGYLTLPSWSPIDAYDKAIEKSSYTLQVPKDITFKYLKSNSIKTDSVLVKGNVIYTWACQNVPSIEYEALSSGIKDITPWVQASPNDFEYDNSKGNVENWKNLGTWVYQLSGDVQTLPANTKSAIANLVANAKTDKEKINILYKYLQSNTRYVSIQLGIGGFKPISADKVAAVNYGDCKALSNYMKAMLSEVNIKSELVMLGSGLPSLNPDYSSFGQANHMALCVPLKNDTTWLECTSQFMPAGFLGRSTSAKNVMLITPEGGKLVKTPVYTPEDNFQNRVTMVNLTADGNADIAIKTAFGSCQYEDNIDMLIKDPTEIRKDLLRNLGIPNMEITSAKYIQPDKDLPKIEENIVLKASEMFSQGGDKLFLTLNLLNRKESVPAKVLNRKTAFSQTYGFKDSDEIIYTLPEGYKAEFIPKETTIISEFGKFSSKAVVKDNTIIYTRVQQLNSNKYPAEKYNDLVDFYKKIYLADKQKAVLAKTN